MTISFRPAAAGARLSGFGAARAARVVEAATLVAPFGKTAAWLVERTGIGELRRLAAGESIADLAMRAGRAAMAEAGIGAEQADAVLVASCSRPSGPGPSLAAEVAGRLAPRAMPVDLNAACAGFCYALASAAALVRAGSAAHVVVIGADQMSAVVDPDDLATSILFGDGAGAAVVSRCAPEEAGIAAPAWWSEPDADDVLTIPAGSRALRMNGPAVFRWAVHTVPSLVTRALTAAGLHARDIDVFVPHQANRRIVDAIVRAAGLSRAVVADDVRASGNTSAASIPLAIDDLRRRDLVTSGSLALLVGFGAGLTAAAQVVRLP